MSRAVGRAAMGVFHQGANDVAELAVVSGEARAFTVSRIGGPTESELSTPGEPAGDFRQLTDEDIAALLAI